MAQERAGVERRLERSSGAPGDRPDAGAHGPGGRHRPGRLRRTSRPGQPDRPGYRRRTRRTPRPGPPEDAPRRRRQATRPARRTPAATSASRIRDLREYDFLEPDARARFDELVERLGKQVLDQFVGGMSDAIRSMTPEDLAANREMVRDLNELIRQRIGGRDPDVSEFMAKHGQFFPGAQSFDDIIDQLAQRMAAMQSLMRSMSPEQRAELQSMVEALLRDDRLMVDLAELASNLDLLLPGGLGDRVRFEGDEPLVARWRPRPDRPAPGDGAPGGRAHRRRRARRPRRHRPRPGPRAAWATTRSATSTRSTTSLGGWRRPAT